LIEVFEQLRTSGGALATRSRIEDGRFVAWLSYPDILAGEQAIRRLRETLLIRSLIPTLRTRELVLPPL
jgi:hypothetical protein